MRKGRADAGGAGGAAPGSGALDELTLTTNGTRLAEFAGTLAAAGVRRINVSLDTLKPDLFAQPHPRRRSARCWPGSTRRKAAGLAVKINTVALAHDNAAEIPALIAWAHGRAWT